MLTENLPACDIDRVTLFNFTLQRGMPIIDQLVRASVRAILRGEYRAEQPFPSVRAIASNLKVHPNAAHDAVQLLIRDGWLEARPGVGAVVVYRPRSRGADRLGHLREDVYRLVLNAINNDLSLADVTDEVVKLWDSIESLQKD
jgi:GntR family transcriptional regulator